jgi:hypothetical protein
VPAGRPTRAVTAWTALLLLGLAATPYTVGPGLELVHRVIGSLLFAGQLAYSVGVVGTHRSPVDAALVGVQLVAGVLCFLYFVIGLMTGMRAETAATPVADQRRASVASTSFTGRYNHRCGRSGTRTSNRCAPSLLSLPIAHEPLVGQGIVEALPARCTRDRLP